MQTKLNLMKLKHALGAFMLSSQEMDRVYPTALRPVQRTRL